MREQLGDLKFGVLMGGLSREREVSLRSGSRVLDSLLRQGFEATAIDVDQRVAERLRENHITFAFIALHGRFGEDGAIQGLLEVLGIPYTGSGVLASSIGMNKVTTKRLLTSVGVPTAPFSVVEVDRGIDVEAKRLIHELGLPLVVKPVAEGSSIGVQVVDSAGDLGNAIRTAAFNFGKVFVEKYVQGREVTVGILGTNGASRALPVLELKPKNRFYDYQAKYTDGMTELVCPADLPVDIAEAVQQAALGAHVTLGCRGMSRVDAIIAADGSISVLEVNTIPGLTDLSDLPAQARAAGMSFDELVFEIVKSGYVEHHPERTNGPEHGPT